jgi:hypothetical protein
MNEKRSKPMKKKTFVIWMTVGFLMLSGLFPSMVLAETPKEEKKKEILHPLRADVKPKIDGILDEDIWQGQPLEKPFSTYYPHYGESCPYKTQIWMTYDDKNLYFAFMCFDDEPKQIRTHISRRDWMFNDDWVGLSLDAMGTQQTAYAIFTNPSGTQADILDSTVTGSDVSADFVWESAGKVTDFGYQVEIAIPLRNIVYKSGKEVKMGILFWRNIPRLAIRASWPAAIPGGRVFAAHTPIIYKNLKKILRLELLPNVVYGSNQERLNPDHWKERNTFKEIGLAIRYGLTSSVNVDVTFNPDFSQVESDAYQVEVNQRYPLFYSEKRPFFMEGKEFFDFFTLPANPFNTYLELIVPQSFFPNALHTRRIMDPTWGAKLSGTIGKATFGILTIGDEQPGQPWDSGVNPNEGKNAFWGIARGKYSLGRDNYIGLFYSGREFAHQYNRVWGTDFFHRFASKYHKFRASFLHSTSSGDDPNQPELKSSNFNFMYDFTSDKVRLKASFEHIGTDFRLDTAYLTRTGINHGVAFAQYNYNPKSKALSWLKQLSPGITYQYLHDLYTNIDDSVLMVFLKGWYSMSAYSGMGYAFKKESWMGQTYDLKQAIIYGQIQLKDWLLVHGRFSWGDKIYYEGEPSLKGKGYDANFFIDIQPSERLYQHFASCHSNLVKDNEKKYNVDIFYSRTRYNINKYLFVRALFQYNNYQKKLMTDFLVSYRLAPGTVAHVGYGDIYENRGWENGAWVLRQGDMLTIKRSFFAKISYRWHL